MKGLVGALVGGGPGARALWAPPLNPALGVIFFRIKYKIFHAVAAPEKFHCRGTTSGPVTVGVVGVRARYTPKKFKMCVQHPKN